MPTSGCGTLSRLSRLVGVVYRSNWYIEQHGANATLIYVSVLHFEHSYSRTFEALMR